MTLPRIRATLAGLAVIALTSGGLSACTASVGYAVIVNGTVISQSAINQDLADIAANAEYVKQVTTEGGPPVFGTAPGTYNKAFVASVLQQLVQAQLIHAVVVAAKAAPTAEQVASAKTAINQDLESQAYPNGTLSDFPTRYQNLLINQQAETDSFINVETRSVSQAALKQYYQGHLLAYTSEWCVRFIAIGDTSGGQPNLPASLADAQRIKGLLDAGGDFTALAQEYSTEYQGSNATGQPPGGMLTGSQPDGCLSMSDLSQIGEQALSNAVVSLPVNTVSDPVAISGGYALIEVTKRVIEPLDSTVTMDIKIAMAGQKYLQLAMKAKMKVNPEFGSFNPKLNSQGQITGVLPPVVPTLGTTTTTTTAPASSGG